MLLSQHKPAFPQARNASFDLAASNLKQVFHHFILSPIYEKKKTTPTALSTAQAWQRAHKRPHHWDGVWGPGVLHLGSEVKARTMELKCQDYGIKMPGGECHHLCLVKVQLSIRRGPARAPRPGWMETPGWSLWAARRRVCSENITGRRPTPGEARVRGQGGPRCSFSCSPRCISSWHM